ncbi:MAG: ABC transporter ATP-binding protein [Vitreoscilla sp.]|nr:ABC transporter ATP-binding protein [Vitreoscilla sp.]
MIELRNLTKSYPTRHGRKYVFRDLNFTLPTGSGVGLIGRNGAGKSTLLNLLGGLDAPDSGEVITDQNISWPVGLSGGFQGSLSARDNTRFVCRVFGATGPEMREKVAYVQAFAEIGDYFDLPMRTYSPGMRARVAFGMSMAFDFDYYLIDEVLAVGDPIFRKKASQVFREKLAHAGVILVTHNHKEIKDMCSTLVFIHNGQASFYDDVDEGLEAFQELLKASQP